MDTCPSTLALDDADLHGGAAAAALVMHLARCARCGARTERRAALARQFDAALAAPLWKRIEAARATPAGWRARWLRLPLAAGTLAALVLVVALARRGGGAGRDYRATKGDLAVEIAARRGQAVFAVSGPTEVAAGDELQLTVRAGRSSARYVLAGSVDGTNHFSPFYPGARDGTSVPLPPAGQPLGRPIVLDDAPGPERILIVVSSLPLDVAVVAARAEAGLASPNLAAALDGAGEVQVRWIVLTKAPAPTP